MSVRPSAAPISTGSAGSTKASLTPRISTSGSGCCSSTATLKTECVIELGGECLDAKDYYSAYGLIVPRGVSPKAARELALKRRTLDGLVERELLFAEAKRLGLGVSEEVLDQELLAGRAHVSLPAADIDRLSFSLGLCRMEDRGGCEPGTALGVRQLRVRRTAGEAFDLKLYEREIRITISQVHTHKIRGADILLIAEENTDLRRAVQGRPDRPGEYRTCYVTVPPTGDRDAFVFQASIVLQELALRMSIAKAAVLDAAGVREHGVHPDVPKNVSKSITVD